jgi:hypothetical protein
MGAEYGGGLLRPDGAPRRGLTACVSPGTISLCLDGYTMPGGITASKRICPSIQINDLASPPSLPSLNLTGLHRARPSPGGLTAIVLVLFRKILRL